MQLSAEKKYEYCKKCAEWSEYVHSVFYTLRGFVYFKNFGRGKYESRRS